MGVKCLVGVSLHFSFFFNRLHKRKCSTGISKDLINLASTFHYNSRQDTLETQCKLHARLFLSLWGSVLWFVSLTRDYLKSTLKTDFGLYSQLCPRSSPVLCDRAGLSRAMPSSVGVWGGLPRVSDPHSHLRNARADLWLTKLCSSHQPFLIDLAGRIPWQTV